MIPDISAPSQKAVSSIQEMQKFVISPGFLVLSLFFPADKKAYAGTLIAICVCIVIWVAPKYGNKVFRVMHHFDHLVHACIPLGMLFDRILERSCYTRTWYIASDSCLIVGAAIVAQAQGTPQFNQWFLYILLVFVVCTLLTEIVYLNVLPCFKIC